MNNLLYFHENILPNVGQAKDWPARKSGNYYYEPKLDGIRCFMVIRNGTISLISRTGHDMTIKYPEVMEDARRTLGKKRTLVLDGELVHVKSDIYDTDFSIAGRRDAQQKVMAIDIYRKLMPMTYVVFDVLQQGSTDLTSKIWTSRNKTLTTLFSKIDSNHIKMCPGTYSVEEIRDLTKHGEGYIYKNINSKYGIEWGKVKNVKSLSARVTGTIPGEKTSVGSVMISLLDSGKPVSAGRVGSGLKPDMGEDIQARLLEVGTTEPIIAEISYLNWTRREDGSIALRSPVFKGLRFDVNLNDCNSLQLV